MTDQPTIREQCAAALYARHYGGQPSGDTWRGTRDHYLGMADVVLSVPAVPDPFPDVQGHCPACHRRFLGSGGYVTCARIDCPDPEAATRVLELTVEQLRAEIRRHAKTLYIAGLDQPKEQP